MSLYQRTLCSHSLLIDEVMGIDIPSQFVQRMCESGWEGITAEDKQILLAGPDHEHYWDTWQDVLQNAVWNSKVGKYYLWQDGDLWVIHEDFGPDDECKNIEIR